MENEYLDDDVEMDMNEVYENLEFYDICSINAVTDDDGWGYYSLDGIKPLRDMPAIPSKIVKEGVLVNLPYVMWYSK